MTLDYIVDLDDARQVPADKRREVLGGKGTHLLEMHEHHLPVPPAFIVTTEACKYFLGEGHLPPGLMDEIMSRLRALPGVDDPARLGELGLFSIRSGAPVSMPGMLRTILNVGMTERPPDNGPSFALASWLRFLLGYADQIIGADAALALRALYSSRGETPIDVRVVNALLKHLDKVEDALSLRGQQLDLEQQVEAAVLAVMRSWTAASAVNFRRSHTQSIPEDTGTAVIIQRMVFGNYNERSGSGVAYSRDPNTGELGLSGDFLRQAQGEDVVGGEVQTVPLRYLEQIAPEAYATLDELSLQLEDIVNSVAEVEFTVQDGRLFLLQARRARMSGAATVRYACQRDESDPAADQVSRRRSRLLWDELTPSKLVQASAPRFVDPPDVTPLGTGVSPGAATGFAAYDRQQVDDLRKEGKQPIWVAEFTNTAQLEHIELCAGVVTTTKGMSSHSIVVARGWGKPVVTGVEGKVDQRSGMITVSDGDGGTDYFIPGQPISIDGTTGVVVLATLPLDDRSSSASPSEYVSEVMRWCDAELHNSGPALRVNADTGQQAYNGIMLGADGVGLARFESLLDGIDPRGSFAALVEMVTRRADRPDESFDAFASQRLYEPLRTGIAEAYSALFAQTIGARTRRPCTVRLVDELPRSQESSLRRGLGLPDADPTTVRLRGAQIFVLARPLVELQVNGLVDALGRMHDPRAAGEFLEIVIPFCMSAKEFRRACVYVREAFREINVEVRVGAMLETPRALLLAEDFVDKKYAPDQIANFVSLGLNDLTELVMGLVQVPQVVKSYRNQGILTVDPIVGLDRAVANLVGNAVVALVKEAPGIDIHVASEQANDGPAVQRLIELGVNVFSSAPGLFGGLRLAAAKANAATHLKRGVVAAPVLDPEPGRIEEAMPDVVE